MKLTRKTKTLGAALLVLLASGMYLIAADHIDAPGVTGAGSASLGSDITDVYAFANGNNMVFVVNTQGLLSPAASGSAAFDEEVMLEINIDNGSTKDNIEDLVIQATFENGKVRVYGPAAPVTTGLNSTLLNSVTVEANITPYGQSPVIGEQNGIKVFAGPRDDPFFFDLGAYKAVLGGTASSFNNPGTDTFAGTNVMALVIEVPKSQLGSGTINIWATSNRKM
ncbi:MAG: DUF4331 family protein [Cyclobacteriaceae bacterium]|jgi:hypothetical protein|nr:DUF4331 family protein [Cyclobacteriaceae bacterium]